MSFVWVQQYVAFTTEVGAILVAKPEIGTGISKKESDQHYRYTSIHTLDCLSKQDA
jgi:hypothetical protein